MEHKDEDYKYVVKVSYSNHTPQYYNSAHYMLVSDPIEASRYLTMEGAQKNCEYASCQGGEGSVEDFNTERKEYLAKIKELNKYD